MCITEFFTVEQRLAQYCKSTILQSEKKSYKMSDQGTNPSTAGRLQNKAPPKPPFKKLEPGWGRGIFSKCGFPALSTSCCLSNMGGKAHSGFTASALQLSEDTPCRLQGSTAETELPEHRAAVFNHRDRTQSPGEIFQASFPPEGFLKIIYLFGRAGS